MPKDSMAKVKAQPALTSTNPFDAKFDASSWTPYDAHVRTMRDKVLAQRIGTAGTMPTDTELYFHASRSFDKPTWDKYAAEAGIPLWDDLADPKKEK
jgi:hypothetical protein